MNYLPFCTKVTKTTEGQEEEQDGENYGQNDPNILVALGSRIPSCTS